MPWSFTVWRRPTGAIQERGQTGLSDREGEGTALSRGAHQGYGSARRSSCRFGAALITEPRELLDERLARGLPVVAREEEGLLDQFIRLLRVGERDSESTKLRHDSYHHVATGTVRALAPRSVLTTAPDCVVLGAPCFSRHLGPGPRM